MDKLSLIGVIGKPELDMVEVNKFLDIGLMNFLYELKQFDSTTMEFSFKHLIESFLQDVGDGRFSEGHENASYSPYMGMLVAKIISKIIKSDLTDTDTIGGILLDSVDKVVFKYIATKIILGLHVTNCA